MDIQRLRCKVNFHALAFVPHVRALGDALISRLRYPAETRTTLGTNYLRETTDRRRAGKFVALHLRFDKVYPTQVTDSCNFVGLLVIINYRISRSFSCLY